MNLTTQKAVRDQFREEYPDLDYKKINGDYKTDTRCAFCDYVDHLNRAGIISNKLAARVTL